VYEEMTPNWLVAALINSDAVDDDVIALHSKITSHIGTASTLAPIPGKEK